MKHEQTIADLLKAVGGKENIKTFENCATRLRIILKNDELVDKKAAENVTEAKGYFFNTGQHQFIFGTGLVNEVNQELKMTIGSNSEAAGSGEFKEEVQQKLPPLQQLVRTLGDILVPLIPVLVTTGLLMGVRGLLLELGVQMDESWLSVFEMLTDTAFAFLPVLITYSATRKFGGTISIGIVVGLMMVAPQLPNAWAVAGGDAEPLRLLGINVIGYQGSIIPAIVAGYLVSKIEKSVRKFVPNVMDLIVTPFVTLSVTIFIMLLVLGPVLQALETGVLKAIVTLVEAPFGIGYIIYAAFQQLIVITGLHHSLSIIELGLLSDTGGNVLTTLGTASMAGQFGAAVAAALLINDNVRRANALSSTASTLFGITEPLLFGINLRSLRIFIAGMFGGAAGGLVTSIFNLRANGLGITFIPGILLYTDSVLHVIQYLIVIAVAFAVGFLFVRLQSKQVKEVLNTL